MKDEVKVSLVTAVCILALAIISKNVLNVQLDFITQYGPVWVYMAYIGTKDKTKKLKYWSLVIILVTIATLVLYAI
jgi:hypothetical protein